MKIPRVSQLIVMIFLSGAAWAQPDLQIQAITKHLSAKAQTIIERLGELDHLPENKWRFHVGDMPHGEQVNLNDSSWKQVEKASEAPTDTVWYRQWIEVPKKLHGYDLTGARIWFQFSASAKGPVQQIVYFNGRRVALGDDLEPIILFDQAKPGDKILVAVKLLVTTDTKHFHGAELKIDFSKHRLNPEEVRAELLSAVVLLPSFPKNKQVDLARLENAIQSVDLKAIDAGDQVKFDASLKQAASMLQPVKLDLQQATLYLIGNSHIDAAWLWPWTETVDVVKRTFTTALQLMNEYPDYKYVQSTTQYNEWIAEKYPAINDDIKRRIKQGRWEIVGGMWVEPDLNMPDGESIARSLLISKRWIQKEYGVDVRIGWNPDSFGYNWQLPQIYKKSGIDYFVTQKMQWNDTNQLPFKLFWWESPDGSKVLTYFPHEQGNRDLSPVRLSADLATARQQVPGLTKMMDLYGVGDHGGGPTRTILDEGMTWMETNKIVPTMKFSGAQQFFSAVEKQLSPMSPEWDYQSIAKGYHETSQPTQGQVAIPTWKSEMYLEYHRGVLTTQANHKRNMRESVEWALNAEKYASLAWLHGDTYPGDQLTEVWKKITFNDFHDLAAGSGIGIIYKDAQRDYDQVHWSTNEISKKALNTIAGQVNTHVMLSNNLATGSTVPILIFNPLAWRRSGVVTVDVQLPIQSAAVTLVDAQDMVLPSQVISYNPKTNSYHLLVAVKNVPSLGYKLVYALPEQRAFESDLKVNNTTLENAILRIVINRTTGCMTNLYNKKTKFEFLAAGTCGNELQIFKDTPKKYDAWNIDPGTLDKPLAKLMKADSVELVEQNPLRAVIRITRTWQHSKFVQDIVLYSGSDEVEVVNDIDWHESHVLLKAAFPLAATSLTATYEIPYGSIDRPTTRNNSWEQAQFEVSALRWADLGDGQHGFSLINECKYGYDAHDNVLRLSLLRSPTSPDPEADRGHHHFSYALYPHAGNWKQAQTVRHGYAFNYKLTAVQVDAHSGTLPREYSFVSIEPDNVMLTAMKKAEDTNSLLFHLYESAGKATNVELAIPPGAISATQTNLLEQPLSRVLMVKRDRVTILIHPYEILALRVDYRSAR